MMLKLNSAKFDFKYRGKRLNLFLKNILKPEMNILYIGARDDSPRHIELFKNCNVTILEIFESNVVILRRAGFNVIQGDVKTFDPKGNYDIILWSHGPEHLHLEDIPVTLLRIEDYTSVAVVLMCPWGLYEQGEIDGNNNELHLSHLQPSTFEKLGYSVEIQGIEGVGSNLMATKIL